jgi:hypothetical protein
MNDTLRLVFFPEQTQNAVVRADEVTFIPLEQEGSTYAAYSRVNDRDMNGSSREVSYRMAHNHRRRKNVLGRNSVCQVHNGRLRIDLGNDTFHDAHEWICKAEVACQRNQHGSRYAGIECNQKMDLGKVRFIGLHSAVFYWL